MYLDSFLLNLNMNSFLFNHNLCDFLNNCSLLNSFELVKFLLIANICIWYNWQIYNMKVKFKIQNWLWRFEFPKVVCYIFIFLATSNGEFRLKYIQKSFHFWNIIFDLWIICFHCWWNSIKNYLLYFLLLMYNHYFLLSLLNH